jgi:hypothetical protein
MGVPDLLEGAISSPLYILIVSILRKVCMKTYACFSTGIASELNVSPSNEDGTFVISVDTELRNKLVKRGDAESPKD